MLYFQYFFIGENNGNYEYNEETEDNHQYYRPMYSLDENKQYLAEKVYPTLRAALVAMIEEEPVEPLVCVFFLLFLL